MPETSAEKSSANESESAAPEPLPLKKWRAAPDDLEGLKRYQWRALRAAETAMYRAAEEGDRNGVVKASNQLSKAVGGYRKLLSEQHTQEQAVSLSELYDYFDELADSLNLVLRRHDVKPAAVSAVVNVVKGRTDNGAAER